MIIVGSSYSLCIFFTIYGSAVGMLPKYIDQIISKYIPMFYEGDLGLGEANILENLNLLCCDTSRPCFNMADIFWSVYFGRKPAQFT